MISSPLTQRDIEEGLRKLGLCPGDAVEVHGSLSSFGWVDGGVSTVIEALMNVVGEGGALVMSAYPVSPPLPLSEEEKARGIIWKVRKLEEDSDEKTGMGAIADEFRKRPDVICGTGLHRVCAWGRDAHLHSKGYRHLLDVDGWALLLGVGFGYCSSMHIAEHVRIPEKITRNFAVPEDIERDYPADEWAVGHGSTPGNPWEKVWEEARRAGLVSQLCIGKAECSLFKARAVVEIYETLRRTDPYGLFGLEENV